MIKKAYDSEEFRQNGYKVVDILADYLAKAGSGQLDRVLTDLTPEEMLQQWHGEFPEEPSGDFFSIIKKEIELSNHLLHPKYVGHQVSPPLPLATLGALVSAFLNNSNAIYEMGPSIRIIEKKLIDWMCRLIGHSGDGFFTSGGTLGNMTALLAMRQSAAGYDIWSEGVKESANLAVMVSEQCHYAVKRSLQIMGFGEDSIIPVPYNDNFQMDTSKLEEIYNNSDKKIICIAASACSTATGSYDDLVTIGEFCKEKDIWFHVDGAHGASAIMSDKYRYLLKGIEMADSVVWDMHKMMLMPSLSTAIIFKNPGASYEAFSQKASYLFEKNAQEEWYNLAHRTMECTKTMMAFNIYTCLSVYGTKFFGNYIDSMYDLTREFTELIKQEDNFELAMEPQSNIICFSYPGDNSEIRKSINAEGSYYLVQTTLNGKVYLRCTIINPLTTIEDLKGLIERIKETARVAV